MLENCWLCSPIPIVVSEVRGKAFLNHGQRSQGGFSFSGADVWVAKPLRSGGSRADNGSGISTLISILSSTPR